MRYIDWIAFAYKMRNIVRNLKVELDVIITLDIETRIEKMKSYIADVNGALEFIVNADVKKAITSILGIQAYQELLVEIELFKSLITLVSSDVSNQLIIDLEAIITKMKLIKLDNKFNFNISAEALDCLTKLTNYITTMSALQIDVDAYSGVLHEVMRTLEFTFDATIDTAISKVIELYLEIISVYKTTIDFELVLASILDAFYLNVELTSTTNLSEVKTKISNANTKFNLDIFAVVKKELMRKLLATYPILLSSVLKMSIVDFYYIYE